MEMRCRATCGQALCALAPGHFGPHWSQDTGIGHAWNDHGDVVRSGRPGALMTVEEITNAGVDAQEEYHEM